MNANEINQTFDLVSFVGALVKLAKKKNYHTGPCPICGGRDRFTIKSGGGDRWHCRKCSPDGYHTPIDFFMQYYNVDFKEALSKMGGEIQKPAPIAPRQIHPAPVQVVPDREWQEKAWKQIDAASDCLLNSDAGDPGRRYLTGRGIHKGMWNMCLLGYGVIFNRPAVFIPWLDLGNVVTAVKYRFMDELAQHDKNKRFAMMTGSLPYLFGLQHVLPSDQTLVFVEGELNAISVLQTLPRGVSVVSAGSDSNGKNDALLHALAFRYDRIVIWMDDPEKVIKIGERMNRRDAKLIKSPKIDNKEWDANEMLQAGLLMDFIKDTLSAECFGIPTPAPAMFTKATL